MAAGPLGWPADEAVAAMTHPAENDAPWTGCAHCGQTLPHRGTGWREAARCRLFQRIAEAAWTQGYEAGTADGSSVFDYGRTPNPYYGIPPEVDQRNFDTQQNGDHDA